MALEWSAPTLSESRAPGASALSTPNISNLLYLWDRRTLFIGSLADQLDITQAASALIVSLDEPLRVKTRDMQAAVKCQSLLLAAGQTASVELGDAVVAVCYLDPLNDDYSALLPLMTRVSPTLHIGIREEQLFQHAFRRMTEKTPRPDEAYATLDRLILRGKPAGTVADPRVARVIELIKQSVTENRPVEALAQEVNLSVSRLVELFRQQIGVPIRRYRQWHRMYITAVGVAQGQSLTEAAIAAGFTDSPHLSHTFRTMFGIQPSVIFAQLSQMKVFVPLRPELDASLPRAATNIRHTDPVKSFARMH
ncbi:helix-turn-helix domain-containing protein [Allohahella marinimesophila]|uniref:HTH araC/xylS-type domain-containing protein n=1 Tax=Allohahella marinimesophila TaxID=1054972 RepID=A0ABP7P7W5_9GAMM